MPYWPHMKLWLRGAERMSYLMSQGVHRCDAALLFFWSSLKNKKVLFLCSLLAGIRGNC